MSNKGLFYRAGDDVWFIGVYSNNFEDIEGEVFSESSHEEYVAWLKETNVKPPITVMHRPKYKDAVHILNYMSLVYKEITPEKYTENLRTLYKPYAIAETKSVFTVNGFTFVVGKVYDNKRKVVEDLMNRSWGMSHGFLILDSAENVIEKYRSFEFTILPEFMAANKITAVGIVKGEMDMGLKNISDEDRKLLEGLLQGSADDVETATQQAKDILSKVLGSKEVDVEEDEEDEKEKKEEMPGYEHMRSKIFADLQVDDLVASLKSMAQQIETLSVRLEVAEKTVKVLKMSDDAKVASHFEPVNWMGLLKTDTKETPQSDQEIIEELKKDIPVDTKEASQENPIQLGLWNLWK